MGATAAVGSPKKGGDAAIRVDDVSAAENLDGERKTVTALFADIKGSTELMEDLDPEEARAIIDPALKLMIEAVRRYDGYVVQSTGDGIFALFGAPIAHEDHPQRALYTALRLQEQLRRYSGKVVADGGAPIEARVGVNTGEVVVRSIMTGTRQKEYTPIGHTTNLASRMQIVAPTGSIAVSEKIRNLCEGYFALKSLGPTGLKGVSEPVNVYEVIGLGPLRTRLQRSAGRGFTKFVGREREIEAMKHAADQAKAGRGQIVAVMAEPGVGKSRLFHEFKSTSQSGWMVLETFSISHGKTSAYLPVLDLMHGYFKITVEDDERTRREKVTGRLLALDRSLEDALPYLFSLLGLVEETAPLGQMDGQLKKRRTLEAIKRIILCESLNQPLMLIFEDLHWIDEQTQELLNLLVDSIGTAKVFLLVNYRPEYSHQWNSKTYYNQLRLDPLGMQSAEEMLTALVGDGVDVRPLKRLIVERTGGNAFFMEEIVQSLLEDGVLQRNEAGMLAKSTNAVRVPTTVQGVIAARIDRLSAEQKELLQTLAVLGREFPFGLVRSVTLKPDDDLNEMLSALQLAEFIYEQPSIGDTEFIFKHALTQEVAYNSLLIERRKVLHEQTGTALESMFALQLNDHLDELAHHYRASHNVAKAVEYLGRAGQQAAQRSAYVYAIDQANAALDLLQKQQDSPERGAREISLQLTLAPALVAVKGGWTAREVEQAYGRARELCELLGDPPETFTALNGLWAMHALRGELQKAYALAEQLLHRAEIAHDPTTVMYARYALGFTSFWMGEFLSAREHLGIGLTSYTFARDPLLASIYGFDAGVNSQSYLAWTLWHLGYPDEALKRSNEALAVAQTLSLPINLAFAEGSLAAVRQSRREVLWAKEKAESTLAIAIDGGATEVVPIVTALRGWALANQTRYEQGIEQIKEGVASLRRTGTSLALPYLLSLLADACNAAGYLDIGESALIEALEFISKQNDHSHQAELHRLNGELLLARHAPNEAQAEQSFCTAIEISRKQEAKSWELRATTSLARLLASQSRRDEARTMLAEIYNWFTEGFDTADLKEAKALLEELNG